MKKKIILAWSGGKDSSLSLYELQKDSGYEIVALLTTITKDYDRISMHGVRTCFLQEQAKLLGIALEKIYVTKNTTNDEYEAGMRQTLMQYKNRGVNWVAFGDIFLEDLRLYREKKLSSIGMTAVFPVWRRNTPTLARSFIDLGFKAIVTCVDSAVLDKKFCGRVFDKQFLVELPQSVDPCGENGEFHSFVSAGPIFAKEIPYKRGEVVLRDSRFYYCDLEEKMPISLSLPSASLQK